MTILALDTSGPVAGVALLQDGALRYEAVAVNRHTHSANIMPMVEEAFLHTDLAVKDITLFAAVKGPGSFTGVRIGVTAVKAMAHAAGIPCVGIDALEALAAGVLDFPGIICPIQDARVSQVYGAAFRGGKLLERLMEDAAMKLPEYLDAISNLNGSFLFLGDGAAVYRDRITDMLGKRVSFALPHQSFLRPASVAWLALQQQDKAEDYLSLTPLYLRVPQAERERLKREAAHA